MHKTKTLALVSLGLIVGSCSNRYYEKNVYHSSYKKIIDSYVQETEETDKTEKDSLQNELVTIDNNKLWWTNEVSNNIFANSVNQTVSPSSLYSSAIAHSPQVKVFSELPLIRETSITEAEGRFDTRTFLEGKWEKARMQRSSVAQTAHPIFHENSYSLEGGVKRRLESGGEITASQRFSHLNNNSISLSPNAQAESAFTVSLVHPLLKGAGLKYNGSIIEIAKIDLGIADEEFKRQVIAHLTEVNKAYWVLYLARGQYLINKKLYAETKELTEKLRKRGDLDTVKEQLLRAEAALAERETVLIRSEVAIRNTESRLKILVNSPQLKRASKLEFLPTVHPHVAASKSSLKNDLITALKNRPVIDQAFAQLQALDIRKDMSKNELLPQLNAILEVSLHGLEAEDNYGDAFGDQPNQQRYLAGFSYDFPIQNRGAKARHLRRNLEYRQQLEQINATIDTTLFEVKVSHRELETARREVVARQKSLQAATNELDSMKKRWDFAELKGEKGGATYMQFLLDSQERQSTAEEAHLNALVNYSIAVENLERAKGTLLNFNKIVPAGSDRKQDKKNRTLPTKGMKLGSNA